MSHEFAQLMFTDSVKDAQLDYGSRERLARFTEMAGPNDQLTEREAGFIAERDSFYLASVNQDGWPYVQHRGGPPGFLRVLDHKRVAYADFRGNMQLISVGNVRDTDKVSLILVDYPHRRRLKVLGRMQVKNVEEVSPEDLEAVSLDTYRAAIERVVYIDVAAFDWNCPQHITPRYTEQEWLAMAADIYGELQ